MKNGNPKLVMMLIEEKFRSRSSKREQLNKIESTLKNIDLNENTINDLLKGYHYNLTGKFRMKDSKEYIDFQNHKI